MNDTIFCLCINLYTLFTTFTGITEEDKLDRDKQLGDLGLDSLLGVEVKLALENDYNLSLSPKEIREVSINELQKLVDKQIDKDDKSELYGIPVEMNDLKLELEYFLTPYTLAEMIPKKKILKLNDVTEGTPLLIMHHIFGKYIIFLMHSRENKKKILK